MTAADRLAQYDNLDATDLCARADNALTVLVNIMNQETTLLRAGRLKEAGTLTPEKTQLAQDYVAFARAIQRQTERLRAQAPEHLAKLQQRHESLATQMAENLRVLATAKTVTESLLTDVAKSVGGSEKPKTYGTSGQLTNTTPTIARGLSVDRAL